MIKRVARKKLAQIEREGGSLKDFFKGIVYNDYEIAIQNLVEKAPWSKDGLRWCVDRVQITSDPGHREKRNCIRFAIPAEVTRGFETLRVRVNGGAQK